MPIINQNLDTSEKKIAETVTIGALATGVTSLLKLMPFDGLLQGFNLAVFGVSGSPAYSLSVYRATSGGQTTIPLGVSLSGQAFGTSGPVGATISGAGVTLLAGDALVLVTGGANSAVSSAVATTCVSALADFKSYQNTVS
jgi:hypothetical protein